MKVLSLFSGIGAFEKALKNLDIPFELVGYCEIDKYASKSYSAIHDVPETMNLGDITKIDEKALPKDIDLITYGFPCQDISLAGKQKGLFNEDGTQTRSGLFFEALRIIEETQPKIAIAENVKNLVGKKFNAQFQVVLASLEAAGYNNYWQVLNAKDYGIPQNRERVFIVSIRKDIDTGSFTFPEPIPLTLRLKDMLEDEVDEKFYLSDRTLNFFIENTKKQQAKGNGFKFEPTDGNVVAKTITTRAGSRMDDNFIDMLGMLDIKGNEQVRRVYGADGISPTLNTMQGGNRQPKVLVREATKKGYAEAVEGDSINLEQPNSKTRRGRVGHGVAQTLTTSPQQGVVVSEPKIDVVGNYSPSGHDASRIVSAEGLAPTVKENHGTVTAIVEPLALDEQNGYIRKDGCVGTLTTDGSSPKHNNRVIEPTIKRVDIPQTVKVRKYPVDCDLLCECLRKHKITALISNREIAEALNVPLTKVEHWFRKDDCFSIPEAELWLQLKTLLGIETDEFDEAIMTFEEKEGVFEKSERHYFTEGIAPTLTSTSADEKVIFPDFRIRKLTPKECFRLMGFDDEDFSRAEAVNSNTQLYKQAGNSIVVDVIVHLFTNLKGFI